MALFVPFGASATDPERAEILRRIGQAIATDGNLSFQNVEIVSTAAVAAGDEREWEDRIKSALSILYAPPGQPPARLDYAHLRDILAVEMAGDRTPDRVVEDVVAAGRTIASVKWSVAGLELDAYAVFDADTVLFDTILSMPIILEPVFSTPHL